MADHDNFHDAGGRRVRVECYSVQLRAHDASGLICAYDSDYLFCALFND